MNDDNATPEQHVQALVDILDDMPEDVLAQVIDLADAAGFDVSPAKTISTQRETVPQQPKVQPVTRRKFFDTP